MPSHRQRRCAFCKQVFFLCRPCDRGHRYCTPPCRLQGRRLVLRRARARHQKSPLGRLDHRDRQRAYRDRQRQRRVMDLSSPAHSGSAKLGPVGPTSLPAERTPHVAPCSTPLDLPTVLGPAPAVSASAASSPAVRPTLPQASLGLPQPQQLPEPPSQARCARCGRPLTWLEHGPHRRPRSTAVRRRLPGGARRACPPPGTAGPRTPRRRR